MIRQVLFVLILIISFLTCLESVRAEQGLVPELAMNTDVGQVVLTVKPCTMKNRHGFEYEAYATEAGHDDHPGCWKTEGPLVYVWFPEISTVATYKKMLFVPRQKI